MYKIPQEKIDEVRSSINVVHYISQFVNLKKEGRNFKGLCPFHQEKTPSFVVSPEKQFYHCFGCGQGGNLYTFIMEYEKLSFIDAVTRAAEFAGITLPKAEVKDDQEVSHTQKLHEINETACYFFEKQLFKESNKKQLDYFLNRKLSHHTIKSFRLGYAADSFDLLLNHFKAKSSDLKLAEELGLIQKKQSGTDYYDKFRHRMIFPFFNLSGKIIGFGGRKLKEEQQPKYLNSPESIIYKKGQTLYGLSHAIQTIREDDFIVLVEGYFDLLRLVDAGLTNVVASSGTALTEQQAKLMSRFSKNVFIAYDGDGAGIKAAIRNAQIIENQELNAFIVPMPEGEDPDTFVLKYGIKDFRSLLDQRVLPIQFQLDSYAKKNPNPTMEQKDAFISEVLNELVEFKSTIKTGLYIHHLADKMQMNESMLISEMNRLRRKHIRFQQNRDNKQTTILETEPEKSSIRRGAYKAEEGILEILLNADNELQNFVIANTGNDLFENSDYKGLFEVILDELEESGEISIHGLYANPELNDNQHKILARLTIETFEKDIKYAQDCIFQLKKWSLEKSARDISQHIKAEEASPEAAMHYTVELNRVRKKIARLEREHQESKIRKFD
ncbi:MAG: DNA primase [Calditrichaeota bacterium]|nr:DNA primase [Calditrichota bacterium]